MEKTIKLVSIDKKIPKYLKPFNVDSLKELTLEQGNQFFVKIIQDFKDYKLTLDELSLFGNKIFHEVAKNKHEESDLFFTSLSTSELNFAVRSNSVYGNISMYLKDIEMFLEKYKSENYFLFTNSFKIVHRLFFSLWGISSL
jgi:hypothetical protein